MPRESVPVTPEIAERIVALVARALVPGWKAMPIGGTVMTQIASSSTTFTASTAMVTKDVDIVLLELRGEERKIPTFAAVMDVARQLSDEVAPREDRNAVAVVVESGDGPVDVELIRGRDNAAGGYFVTRRLLETAAALSTEKGQLLVVAPEALAVLKAWAATDKEKLVKASKDPTGFHAARARQFRQDVADILRSILDAGEEPAMDVVKPMLATCPRDRRAAVAGVLRERGWPV